MTALQSEIIELDDDPIALYELSLKEKWGDGAPLIPPTDERVQAMLAETPHKSTKVIAEIPLQRAPATVELAAINAVMAGCHPRAFPLVLAALECIGKPEYNGFGIYSTTGSPASMLMVNGPSRDALEIDYQAGCLGGAAGRGSMTIGRAVALCLRNIGGVRAGATSRSVFGQPARFGLCFGEWEERSAWPSLAERRGFESSQEVVTVHAGMGTMAILDVYTDDDRDLAYLIAKNIAHPSHNAIVAGGEISKGEVVVLLNPMWAQRFGKSFPNIELFQECLFEHAWQPIDFWPARNQRILRDKRRVDARGRVHAMLAPDRLVPVVCGGLGNLHCTLLNTWGESQMQSSAAVRPTSHENT